MDLQPFGQGAFWKFRLNGKMSVSSKKEESVMKKTMRNLAILGVLALTTSACQTGPMTLKGNKYHSVNVNGNVTVTGTVYASGLIVTAPDPIIDQWCLETGHANYGSSLWQSFTPGVTGVLTYIDVRL